MKIKHTLRGLLLVATVVALQPAATFAQGKNERIVVCVPNLAFPFFAFMKTQAEDEGKKLGIQVTVEDGQGKIPHSIERGTNCRYSGCRRHCPYTERRKRARACRQ